VIVTKAVALHTLALLGDGYLTSFCSHTDDDGAEAATECSKEAQTELHKAIENDMSSGGFFEHKGMVVLFSVFAAIHCSFVL
jgi:hypothetical protein